MDETSGDLFNLYLIAAVGLILVVIFGIWSWTKVTEAKISHETNVTVHKFKFEGELSTAKIQQQTSSSRNDTDKSIATLDANTKQQKILADKSNQDNVLAFQREVLHQNANVERMKEENKAQLTAMELNAQANIQTQQINFLDRQLASTSQMHGLDVQLAQNSLDNQRHVADNQLNFQRRALEQNDKLQRYAIEQDVKKNENIQEHEDERHRLAMHTRSDMHHEEMTVRREGIQTSERMNNRQMECREHEASERRAIAEVEADARVQVVGSIVGGVASIATRGLSNLVPIGGGGSGRSSRRIQPLPTTQHLPPLTEPIRALPFNGGPSQPRRRARGPIVEEAP